MPGLYSGDPFDSQTLDALGSDQVAATTGDVLAAAAGGALAGNPTPRLLRAGGEMINQGQAGIDEFGRTVPVSPSAPPLTPEEANRRFGLPNGVLTFDRPVAESTASELHDAKRADLVRADTIARGPGGIVAGAFGRGVTSLAMGVLDPINLAAGFVPGLGEARAAALVGDGVAARALAGATAGATGMAVMEPLNYLLDEREHNDWTMSGALINMAFGSVLGGGLHVAAGAFGRSMEAASPATRDLAVRASVAQMLDGQPIDIAPAVALSEALEPGISNRRAGAVPPAPGNYNAFTPSGMQAELRPEIVSAADLVASHTADGAINPAYPHADGMQPRDRSSIASQAQIAEMASKLEPSRLGPSPEASTGSPIVNQDGVVESGNGRTLALRRMYGDPAYADQAARYRQHLLDQGHDVGTIADPVLIGRRVTDFTPEQARDFALSANERTTLGLSASETARMDATRAGRAVDQLQPGALSGEANKGFVQKFMAQVPAEERGGMVMSDGRLSAAGQTRIRSALLAHAYGDSLGPTLERMLNGETEGMRGLAGGLSDAAGEWGKLRAAAADGSIPAGLDITDALGEAVQLVDRARQLGRPVSELLAQSDMLPPSDAAQALLRLFYQDDGLRRPVTRGSLAELLNRYVDQAMEAKPGPNLFGEPETSAADILRSMGNGDRRFETAAQALHDQANRSTELPEDAAARRAGADAIERAPEVSAEPTKALQEAETAAQAAIDAVQTEIKAGRMTENPPELVAASEAAAAAEREASAVQAAAICLLGV